MNGTSTNVTVFPAIQKKDSRRKPYIVRWKVAGREKSQAFPSKPAARKYQTELQAAVHAGTAFDTETGLPTTTASGESRTTCLELAIEVVAEEFEVLSSKSNGNIAAGLATVLPALVPERMLASMPEDRDVLEQALLVALNPRKDASGLSVAHKRALAWVERNSLPVSQVGEVHVRQAIKRARTKRDGTAAASTSVKRKKSAMSKMFTVAIARNLIEASPLRLLRKTKANGSARTIRPIDATEVATAAEVRDFLSYVAHPAIRLLLSIIFYAGLRPSEADGLRVMDCYLDPDGRPELMVRRATTEGDRVWSAKGASREERELKWRDEGEVRRVPIPAVLADMLAEAIKGKGQDELVVSTRSGTPIQASNRTRAFRKARAAWAAAQQVPPSAVTLHVPYSLRHCAATLWLGIMPPAEVAARLGNTVPVLMGTYANVIGSKAEHYNAAMDQVMGE